MVLREVLPSDLVEPEPEPEPVAEKPADSEADAVYVGGVRMDEYGEFIDDDDEETTPTSTCTRRRWTSRNCPA